MTDTEKLQKLVRLVRDYRELEENWWKPTCSAHRARNYEELSAVRAALDAMLEELKDE